MCYGLRRKAEADLNTILDNPTVPVNQSLLEILCCPAVYDDNACHGHLVDLGDGLLCKSCGLIYPVEDGIPVLLADHARKGDLSADEPESATKHKDDNGKE